MEIGIIFLLIGLGLAGWWFFAGEKDTSSAIEKVDKTHSSMGPGVPLPRAWLDTKTAPLRQEHNTIKLAEAQQYIEQITQDTQAKIAGYENMMALSYRQQQDMVEQAKRFNELTVLQAASAVGLSPIIYEQMLLEAFKHTLTLSLEDKAVVKAFQMTAIEFEAERWMKELDKEMGLVKTLLPYHEYNKLSEMLSIANGQLGLFKRTSFPDDDTKKRELRNLKQRIQTFQDALKKRKETL